MIKQSRFKPAWWLPSPHLQTIWPTLFRRCPKIITKRERLILPDDDFIDIDWAGSENDLPLVLVLHGLEGSIASHYATGILQAVTNMGWQGVFMHFRGCSGEPNLKPYGYHMGETGDVAFVVEALKKRYPGRPVMAVGYSLGGNVLLKWLGESGAANPLSAAVAVSVPFEIDKAATHINKGFSRVYQFWLMVQLRTALLRKHEVTELPKDIELDKVSSFSTFWEFDSEVTAKLHGFKDAYDYYLKTSSRPFLKTIAKPTLVLHSSDDPLMTEDVIAKADELSPYLTLELSQQGGHLGFISGHPWNPKYWLEERIPQYLSNALKRIHN